MRLAPALEQTLADLRIGILPPRGELLALLEAVTAERAAIAEVHASLRAALQLLDAYLGQQDDPPIRPT